MTENHFEVKTFSVAQFSCTVLISKMPAASHQMLPFHFRWDHSPTDFFHIFYFSLNSREFLRILLYFSREI